MKNLFTPDNMRGVEKFRDLFGAELRSNRKFDKAQRDIIFDMIEKVCDPLYAEVDEHLHEMFVYWSEDTKV